MIANNTDLIPLKNFPNSWVDPVSGNTFVGAALETMTEDQLNLLGWFTIIDNKPVDTGSIIITAEPLVFVNNTIEQNYTVTDISLDDYIFEKSIDIENGFVSHLGAITSIYSSAERDSWHIQLAEAQAFNIDGVSPTPFIDLMVSNHPSSTKELIVDNIIVKADMFKLQTATALGKKQEYFSLLDLATTIAEVDLIGIEY